MHAKPVKTMYVTYSLSGGGAERLLTNLVLQHEQPERLVIVTLRPGGVFRRAIESTGAVVVDLGMNRYLDSIPGVFRLARMIGAHRPDIIHGWDYFANVLSFAARRLARSRARLFWAAFGTDLGPQSARARFRAVLRLNVALSAHVDGIAYNGLEVRDHHRALGYREPRCEVISNSIDAEAFQHDAGLRERIRAELGIPADAVVVVIVARVDPQKDWPTTCAAVRDLPNVVTIAVGSGTTDLPPQTGLIQLGWRDDVVSILSASDIFVLASAFGEGCSLALGEAMLCGLPCIVTDVGANGRLVGDAGIVVRPRDAAAIREAVISLANDPERRRALAPIARARAAEATACDRSIYRLHSFREREESH